MHQRLFDGVETQHIGFQGFVVDRARWIVKWKDVPIVLNRKTFDLLLHLIDHRERVLSNDELLKALWPKKVVEESNLTQHVFLLRKALSRHASEARIIETVPGRGYRFVADIECASAWRRPAADVALAPHGIEVLDSRTPSSKRGNGVKGFWPAGIPIAIALFALGVLTGHFWRSVAASGSFAAANALSAHALSGYAPAGHAPAADAPAAGSDWEASFETRRLDEDTIGMAADRCVQSPRMQVAALMGAQTADAGKSPR